MTARWWAFGLWALVAASAIYWGMRLFVPGQPAPAQATLATPGGGPRGDLTRLFGVDAPPAVAEAEEPAPASDRFQLVGVVAPRGRAGPGEGVALIAVDGKPPRAYKVGAAVEGDTVLQAVRARGASLGPSGGAAKVSLEIPPMAPAATGTPGGGMAPPPSPVAPVFPRPGVPQPTARPMPPVVLPPRQPPVVQPPQPAVMPAPQPRADNLQTQ